MGEFTPPFVNCQTTITFGRERDLLNPLKDVLQTILLALTESLLKSLSHRMILLCLNANSK